MNIFEDLVTFNQIRYAAGVSSVEIEDAELAESGLDEELDLALYEWLPTGVTADSVYMAAYAVGAADNDKYKLKALSAYSKYYCAAQLHLLGSVRFAKSITDSENEIARGEVKSEEMYASLIVKADYYKNKLLELLEQTVSTSSKFDLMGISSPGYDPVTG